MEGDKYLGENRGPQAGPMALGGTDFLFKY